MLKRTGDDEDQKHESPCFQKMASRFAILPLKNGKND